MERKRTFIMEGKKNNILFTWVFSFFMQIRHREHFVSNQYSVSMGQPSHPHSHPKHSHILCPALRTYIQLVNEVKKIELDKWK